jgi:CBS domain-containing protein
MEADKAIAQFIVDRPLLSFAPDDRVAAALAAMKEHESDCVLICESDKLRGIFTQRDFLNRVAVVGKSDGALGDVMTRDPNALQEQDSIMVALHRMAVGNYRNVPIVDEGGRAIANLSVWEVMQHLSEMFAAGQTEAADNDLAALGQEPVAALSLLPCVEVEATDRLLSVLSLMLQRACGAVRVNHGDRLAGIFAERDLMCRIDYSSTEWHDTPVSAVMTPDPVCIDRHTSIAGALEQMNKNRFRHLPVVKDAQEENATLVSVREILSFVASRQKSRG